MKSETLERMSIPFLEEAVEERDNLLRQARNEIQMLRRRNEQLAGRAMAYDVVEKIMGFVPPPGGPIGMGVDVIWRIDELLNPTEATAAVEA